MRQPVSLKCKVNYQVCRLPGVQTLVYLHEATQICEAVYEVVEFADIICYGWTVRMTFLKVLLKQFANACTEEREVKT